MPRRNYCLTAITVYAIRHVPSGDWMPARMFRTSARGWSTWKSGPEYDKGYDANPRIFFSLGAASRAAAAWYAGVWGSHQVPGGLFDPPEYALGVTPTCGRDPGTLEIVPLGLTGPFEEVAA